MKLKGYTGYFKTIITFTAVFMFCALLFSIYLGYRASISAAELLNLPFLHQQDDEIEAHLLRYADDVLFLTGAPSIQGIIRAREEGGYDSKEKTSYGFLVKRLQQIFENLGVRKTEYMKLRYVDERGNELVGVDFEDGKARIIPDTELQNKGDRYFFTEAMKLSGGQVYFSNIELSQERGKIAVPYKSILCIATPIFNKKGQSRGIIVSSVDTQFLLHSPGLEKYQKGREIYIVDQEGFYLHHNSDPAREWGSPAALNTRKNLKAYQPGLFRKIMNNDTGMAFSFDSYRFVLFSRIEFPNIKEKYLVIVAEVSPYIILAPMFRTVMVALSFIFFFSVVIYFLGSRATQALREKEAALLSSEERFRRAVMDAAFPMMIQAEDGEVVQINKAWEEISGYAPADIPTISDWMTKAYGQSRTVTKAYIDTIFSLDARKDQGEYVVTAKDGSKHIWDFASAPLGKLTDGRRLVVSMARDITERKVIEAALKKAHEELELRVKERTRDLAEANKLLDALNTVQSMFISETDPKVLYDGISQSILGLTESQYGFMCEVFLDENGAPYLKTHATSNVAWSEETRKFYEVHAPEGLHFSELKSLFGAILTSGQPVISNDPAHDPRRGGLPEGHPLLHAFLGMPLYRGKKLVGAMGVANRPGGYDEDLVNYLQPFLASCASIIEAYRSDQARKQALEEINRNYTVQSTLSAIFKTSLEDISLEEVLLIILKKILIIPWFAFEERGCIFLVEDDPDILIMKACNNFSDQARELCRRIPVGKCHCGQVLLTKKITFSDRVDHTHEIQYEGMAPHGDYCIPILFQDQAIGVLNVYVKDGHQRNQQEEEFLSMVANAIAVIIARKRAEEFLKEYSLNLEKKVKERTADLLYTNAKMQAIFDSAPDAIVSVKAEDRSIIYFSKGAEKVFGYSADEIMGKNVSILMPEPYHSNHERYVQNYLETGIKKIIGATREVNGRKKNGEVFDASLHVSETVTPESLIFNGIIRDISSQKIAQREIEQNIIEIEEAKRAAEAANRAKSDFLASMSHELRTPMNAIIGFSQVLQAKYYGELNEKQVEYVTDILDSGNHLLSLINDILDLSKVEAGKMQLELSQVNIKSLLGNSLVMIHEKALRHGITVELNLPSSLEGLEIDGDERKLKQIIFNLLSNAAKFTPEGGRIGVSARLVEAGGVVGGTGADEGPFIEICVSDTGIGIRAEDQKRIFDPFIQVKGGTTDKTPGTGLGLSLTKDFVELHGGRVWVESGGLGKGSRFYVLLPANLRGESDG